MSGKRMNILILWALVSMVSTLAAQTTAENAAPPKPKIDFGLGVGALVPPFYPFGQASVGGLPETGPGFRLGAMGTFGPNWENFFLVGALDVIGKVGRSKDTDYYIFGGPCALISPLFGVWFDGGVGSSGFLDAGHRSALYAEARFVPLFGDNYLNVAILVSAGIRFNL